MKNIRTKFDKLRAEINDILDQIKEKNLGQEARVQASKTYQFSVMTKYEYDNGKITDDYNNRFELEMSKTRHLMEAA